MGGSRGVAQPGSAPALGAGGRQFKSARPDHSSFFALCEVLMNRWSILVILACIMFLFCIENAAGQSGQESIDYGCQGNCDAFPNFPNRDFGDERGVPGWKPMLSDIGDTGCQRVWQDGEQLVKLVDVLQHAQEAESQETRYRDVNKSAVEIEKLAKDLQQQAHFLTFATADFVKKHTDRHSGLGDQVQRLVSITAELKKYMDETGERADRRYVTDMGATIEAVARQIRKETRRTPSRSSP